MSDYVEKLLTGRLPMLDVMKELNFISPEQEKSFVNNLRDHLIQAEATKEPSRRSIFDYANYEATLLDFIKKKREELKETKYKKDLEMPLARNLSNYLMRRTNRRTDDVVLWRFRINFLLNIGFLPETRLAYKQLTRSNSWHISLWMDWANFEMCINKDFETARKILMEEAPLHHPHTNVFTRELFRLELLFVEHLMKEEKKKSGIVNIEEEIKPENQSNDNKKDELAIARVVYKRNCSKDVQLCIEMHNIAAKFNFASSLREEIFNDLQDKFGKHPEVMHLIHARNVCNIKTRNDDLADNFLLDISPDQDEVEADVEISRKVQGNNIVDLLTGATEKLRTFHLFHLKLYQNHSLAQKSTTANWVNKAANYIEAITEEVLAGAEELLPRYWQEMKRLLYHGWARLFPHILWSLKKIMISCTECLTQDMYLDFCIMYPRLVDPAHKDAELSSRDVPNFDIEEILRSAVKRFPDAGHNVFIMLLKMRPPSVDNSALIEDYVSLNASKSKSTWRDEALKHRRYALHRLVLDKLPDEEKEKFILDDLERSGVWLNDFQANLKIELLKLAYQKQGLRGAREVYKQYGHRFPYAESFQATMFLMEVCTPGGAKAEEPTAKAKERFNFKLMDCGYENLNSKVNPVEDSDSDESDSEKEQENTVVSDITQGSNHENQEEVDLTNTGDNDKSFQKENLKDLEFHSDCNIERVKKILENDLAKSGGKHHDVWLCYCAFNERTMGGGAMDLEKRALDATEPRSHKAFIELSNNKRLRIYANTEEEATVASVNEVDVPSLPVLFELDQHFGGDLSPQEMDSRAAYLHSIVKPAHVQDMAQSNVTWSDVFTVLLDGKKLAPCYLDKEKKSFVDENYVIGETVSSLIGLAGTNRGFFRSGEGKPISKLSDCLHLAVHEETSRSRHIVTTKRDDSYYRDDLRVMHSKSFLLDPMNSKKSWTVEKNSIKREKREKMTKEPYVKKAGFGWDRMGRPEMTADVQADLDTLVMRNVLQPGSHLKKFAIPDNFVMGRIVGGGADFYNKRTKKETKRTIAEEYMDDYENNRLHKKRKVKLVSAPQEAKNSHFKKKALDMTIKKGKSEGKSSDTRKPTKKIKK